MESIMANSSSEQLTHDREENFLLPPVDVVEDASGITLFADFPGVPKDKLNVRIDSDSLTIEGDVVFALDSSMEARYAEIQVPRLRRTFTLGQELDKEKISAEMKNGVLKLHIPKTERAKPRKIEVRVA
jgi:HSP20 family molecular chaperone IbpA